MCVKKAFANRLKQLREEKGLSQTQIADELGISRGSVSFYENGDRTPDIDILVKVCSSFDVSPEYMLGMSNCRKNDNVDISKQFHLSEKAIKNMDRFPRFLQPDVGLTCADILNAFLSDDRTIDLLRSSLSYVLVYTHDDKISLNEIKNLPQGLKEIIATTKKAGATQVAETFAKMLIDMADSDIEPYYKVEKTGNGTKLSINEEN